MNRSRYLAWSGWAVRTLVSDRRNTVGGLRLVLYPETPQQKKLDRALCNWHCDQIDYRFAWGAICLKL